MLGPLLSTIETSTTSWGRDGSVSVRLPNGEDFWLFGDTPRYQYQNYYGQLCSSARPTMRGCNWSLTKFIYGSSAGLVSFKNGALPTTAFQEVVVGRPHSANNQPAQFLPSPRVYLPDGSGRLCNKANGGPMTGSDRWPLGAALLPDQTNVLITFMDVCVTGALSYRAEGWGVAEYNWKTNEFSFRATDVFTPAKSGVAISPSRYFGSPVVQDGKIFLFSRTYGPRGGQVYLTTVTANTAALENPSSYSPVPIDGLRSSPAISVVGPSKTHPELTMYQLGGSSTGNGYGDYRIFTASSPSGPWTQTTTGSLPGCSTASSVCYAVNLHPELSSASELLVTYTVPGYGPGISTAHPYPNRGLRHNVWASIPL